MKCFVVHVCLLQSLFAFHSSPQFRGRRIQPAHKRAVTSQSLRTTTNSPANSRSASPVAFTHSRARCQSEPLTFRTLGVGQLLELWSEIDQLKPVALQRCTSVETPACSPVRG